MGPSNSAGLTRVRRLVKDIKKTYPASLLSRELLEALGGSVVEG